MSRPSKSAVTEFRAAGADRGGVAGILRDTAVSGQLAPRG
jgi:hypothetical protein